MNIIRKLTNKPILLYSVMFYVYFIIINITVRVFREKLNELYDYVAITGYLWPYPFLLSFQTWINPNSTKSIIIAYIIGLGIIIIFFMWIQKLIGKNKLSTIVAIITSLFLWYIPLLIIQVACFIIMDLMGYPVGE